MTQQVQVSHRPIKCQSRLGSQRGTKVNGSHRGDNPLLRPTGIQIATKRYATLQAMAPTNMKTVHQTSLLHIESSLDRLGLIYGQLFQQTSNQPGTVANPSRGQLKQGKWLFPVPVCAWEFGLSRLARPSRPVSARILSTRRQAESGVFYSRTSFDFPRRRPCIIPSTAIGPVPSWSGHAIAYRWRSLPRVRRRRGRSLQGSSSIRCCLFRYHHGPNFVRLSFSTLPIIVVWPIIKGGVKIR